MNGTVSAICICPFAGAPMQYVYEVEAVAGAGLKGDRYCVGVGSWNRGRQGSRQVTLMNAVFFDDNQPFVYSDSRRNIFTLGVELMDLIGREFQIGQAQMRGVKYCYPCPLPSALCDKPDFDKVFHDRGGLIAEITQGGIICTGDKVISSPRTALKTT